MTSCILPECTATKAGVRLSLHLFPDPSREPERHLRWAKLINSEKVFAKDPKVVFKQLRVCRKHFEDQSFNGSCKKLLNSALPSLYLGASNSAAHMKTKLLIYESKVKAILKANSTSTDGGGSQLMTNAIQVPDTPLLQIEDEELSTHDKMWLSGVDEVALEDSTEYELMEVSGESRSDAQQYTIVMKLEDETTQIESAVVELVEAPRALRNSKPAAAKSAIPPVKTPTKRKSNQKSDGLKELLPLSLRKLHRDFKKNPNLLLAQSICSRVDPLEVAISRSKTLSTHHAFQHTVDIQRKSKSDKSSWSSIAHNLMRPSVMKKLSLDDFEFSDAFFFYWDKIERSYHFLHNIAKAMSQKEKWDGRLVQFLLRDPVPDGGKWEMFASIINKHGVMPKNCFPESFSSESSSRLNGILKSKIREHAKIISDLFSKGASDDDIQKKVDEQMGEIYNIVGICLGIPAADFTWEYYDQNKNYHSIGPVTALEFYHCFVRPNFNVDDKVTFVSDPRSVNEFAKGYTVDCLGNVVGGQPIICNNQPVDVLLELVAKCLKAGEAVWIGCDSSKLPSNSNDLDIISYKHVFDTELSLSKEDRLATGDSCVTHAMLITGFTCDEDGIASKFRVENFKQIDEERRYMTMTRQWFEEFVFEIVVDKNLVSKSMSDVFNVEPTILPAWDPMGSLAM